MTVYLQKHYRSPWWKVLDKHHDDGKVQHFPSVFHLLMTISIIKTEKNNSGNSAEHSISPENESLSPYCDSLSPVSDKLSPENILESSTKSTTTGDKGDTRDYFRYERSENCNFRKI